MASLPDWVFDAPTGVRALPFRLTPEFITVSAGLFPTIGVTAPSTLALRLGNPTETDFEILVSRLDFGDREVSQDDLAPHPIP